MSKKTTVSGILLVLLVLATTPLLGTDNVSFLKWWLMTLVLGIGFYPAAAALFPRFHDRGWMFSKVLGIVVSGFAVFALGSFGLVQLDRKSTRLNSSHPSSSRMPSSA